jgi:hypothetical protein
MRILSAFALAIAMSAITQAQGFTDDCSSSFKGKYRMAVKNRKAADGAGYTVHNNGNPITVAKWFRLVCGFDPKVMGKSVPATTAINGIETVKVTHRRVPAGREVRAQRPHGRPHGQRLSYGSQRLEEVEIKARNSRGPARP